MSEHKAPYHLSEGDEIEVERYERTVTGGYRWRIHSRHDGNSIEVSAQGMRELLDELLKSAGQFSEATSAQPGEGIAEKLAALDSLELAADMAEELMIQTNDETVAIAAWRQLKAAQLAQQDIKKSLEAQGYRITLDLEPHAPSRYSVSHPSRKDRDS